MQIRLGNTRRHLKAGHLATDELGDVREKKNAPRSAADLDAASAVQRAIPGDQIAGSCSRAPDGIIARRRRSTNMHARNDVAEIDRAGHIGANVIPLDQIASGTGAQDLDTIVTVSGNDITSCGNEAANCIITAANDDPIGDIAASRRPSRSRTRPRRRARCPA